MAKKNPLLTKAAVSKRLQSVSLKTSIPIEMLEHDFILTKNLSEVASTAYKLADMAKEQNIEARTAFANYIVQKSVVNLCKDVEMVHRRVTAIHQTLPSRQMQYALQDLVAIIDHFGDLLNNGPAEPDSETPLSASMVPDEEVEGPDEEPKEAGEVIPLVPEIAE